MQLKLFWLSTSITGQVNICLSRDIFRFLSTFETDKIDQYHHNQSPGYLNLHKLILTLINKKIKTPENNDLKFIETTKRLQENSGVRMEKRWLLTKSRHVICRCQ